MKQTHIMGLQHTKSLIEEAKIKCRNLLYDNKLTEMERANIKADVEYMLDRASLWIKSILEESQ